VQLGSKALNLCSSTLLGLVLLERTHEGILLFVGLEATVSKLARGVDELEVDLLESPSLCLDQQRLAQSNDALLGSDTAAADHDKVVVHLAVVREATHGSDRLLRDVVLSRSVVLDHLAILGMHTLSHAVDLLVHLRAMMITLLTGTRNRELDTRRMPRTDTSDLAQTLVRLTLQLLGVPT